MMRVSAKYRNFNQMINLIGAYSMGPDIEKLQWQLRLWR